MKIVDPEDRAALEANYTLDDFLRDANRNMDPKTSVLHGIRMTAAPGGGGKVALSHVTRHVGEDAPDQDAVFLAPHRTQGERMVQDEANYDPGTAVSGPVADPARDYGEFLDDLAAAARNARFPDPIGYDEARLKGFHGG